MKKEASNTNANVQVAEGNIDRAFDGKRNWSMAESKTWCMYGNSKRATERSHRLLGDDVKGGQ